MSFFVYIYVFVLLNIIIIITTTTTTTTTTHDGKKKKYVGDETRDVRTAKTRPDNAVRQTLFLLLGRMEIIIIIYYGYCTAALHVVRVFAFDDYLLGCARRK